MTSARNAAPAGSMSSAPNWGAVIADAHLLWAEIERRKARSLAVIPVEAGPSAAAIARDLVAVGRGRARPLVLIEAGGVPLDGVDALEREQASAIEAGAFVVVSMDPIRESETSMRMVMHADLVVVIVRLGALLATARATVSALDPPRVLGCIATTAA